MSREKLKKGTLRKRAKKADKVTDEMWSKVSDEHRFLVAEYLDVTTHLSEKTKIQYESGLKHFFWWVHEVLNDKPLNRISRRDFMRYMSFLSNRGLSSSAMSFKKSAVSSFNTHIENIVAEDDPDNYGMFRNFTQGLQPIAKNEVYTKEAITYDEYRLMMDTLIEDEDYLGVAWVATAFNTGARRSEIIQMRTEILEYPVPEKGNYVMSHTIMGKGRGGGKPIEYMINLEALKYMQMWIDHRNYDHEYIFTTDYDGIKQMSDTWANYFCTNVLSDIVGRRINPHIFKASAITFLLEQGVPMNMVSKYVAQHEDVATTQRFYDLRSFEEEKSNIFNHIE